MFNPFYKLTSNEFCWKIYPLKYKDVKNIAFQYVIQTSVDLWTSSDKINFIKDYVISPHIEKINYIDFSPNVIETELILKTLYDISFKNHEISLKFPIDDNIEEIFNFFVKDYETLLNEQIKLMKGYQFSNQDLENMYNFEYETLKLMCK